MRAFSVLLAGRTVGLFSTLEGTLAQLFSRVNYFPTGAFFIFSIFLIFELVFPRVSPVLGESSVNFLVEPKLAPTTESLFTDSTIVKTETLKFKTKQIADPALKEGETKIVQAGSLGKKVISTKTIFHNGVTYSTEASLVSEVKPVDEVVAVAASVVEQIVQTPYGPLKYSQKLSVWATSYDPNCNGCNSTTSIGLKAGYGVIAVDPKVIPLRSKVYVPGYGLAIAGDTGGSIKGNKVDLGFDNVQTGNWSARTTELYILSP